MSFTHRCNHRLLIACLGAACVWSGSGCYRVARGDPFAQPEPEIRVEGLAGLTAGALGGVGMALNNAAAGISGRSPRYVEHGRTLADPESQPDELREAIMSLVSYEHGREAPYTEAYAQYARGSPHALVRASAIRALNISRHRDSTPVFIERLSDSEASVRLEAAKALANMPDPAAEARLLAIAQDRTQNLDVRIAAIDALRHSQEIEMRRALVRMLEAEDFSLVWQARQSLVHALGEDHGFDAEAWLRAAG